jgi:hypothetical protein
MVVVPVLEQAILSTSATVISYFFSSERFPRIPVIKSLTLTLKEAARRLIVR